MKTLKEIEYLPGVKVLLRVDFNVPIRNGIVQDDYRIKSAMPTIEYLVSKGAKVIIISHLEAADGSNPTLLPVAKHMEKLGKSVLFIKDFNKAHDLIEAETKNGSVVMLENLRFFDGEKANSAEFARDLASLGDLYVNDAFSVCHREHSSIVGVPKLMPSYAGLQLEKEISALSSAFDPQHPFLFILGGAKFSTKMPLVSKFLKIADMVYVGGALANDLFLAKGYEVGRSVISKETVDLRSIVSDPKVVVPSDITDEKGLICNADQVSKDMKILDLGPKSIEELSVLIKKARFILWNGPFGQYENGYKQGTLKCAELLSQATKDGAHTIVGGGDTLAAIKEISGPLFSFISTGGGAMWDFLAFGTLPGIVALG